MTPTHHTKTSTAMKAARAHERMKGIMRHHRDSPWATLVVVLVLLVPVLLLVGLAVFG